MKPSEPTALQQDQVQTLPASVDWQNQPVNWDGIQGKPVIVFFFKEGKSYCEKGLESVVERLNKDRSLSRKIGFIVVQVGDEDPVKAKEFLLPGKMENRIVRAAEKQNFASLRAVAYPTVYICAADLKVLHTVKGWGPSFGLQALSAARYAVGEYDKEQFEAALEGRKPDRWSKAQRGLLRTVEASYRSAAVGKLSRGQRLLSRAVADFEAQESDSVPADALEAMCRFALLAAEVDVGEAQKWMERLQSTHPEHPRLAMLNCRLALAKGDPQAAQKALAGQRDRGGLEIRYLQSRIREAEGDVEHAIEAYREQLDHCIVEQLTKD